MKLIKRVLLRTIINSYRDIELNSYSLKLNIKDSHIEYTTKYTAQEYSIILKNIQNNGVEIDNLWINPIVIESIELIEVDQQIIKVDYFDLARSNYTEEEIEKQNEKYTKLINQYNLLKGEK